MANLFQPSLDREFNNSGTIASGAKLYFYLTNTTTLAPIYTTSAGTTPLTNPVVADSVGVFPAVFLDPATVYRVRWTDSAGVSLRPDVDPIPGELGTVGATGAQGIQGPVGATLPGRRLYATYASAVSDAATPVIYAAVYSGAVADIPTTDSGTHTDPVVGGTVNNSGTFRWSVSPAGWQRISDVDAVSGVNAVNALAATVYYPRDNDKLANLNSSFSTTATINPDYTLTLNNTSKNCRMDNLPTDLLAARTAGKAVTFLLEKVSGVDLSGTPSIFQLQAFTTLVNSPMVALPNGSWSLTVVLNVSTDNIQVNFASTGTTTLRFPVYAIGTPARAETDPLLLTAQGMARSATDTVSPIFYQAKPTLTGGTTWTPSYNNPVVGTGQLNIPNGGGSWIDLYCPLAIADTKPVTVTFDCTAPLHNIVNGASVVYLAGHAGGAVPAAVLEKVGPKTFQIVFQTLMAGGFTFDGLRISFSNSTGATVILSNFLVWPTDTLPSSYAVPSIVKTFATAAAYSATSNLTAQKRIHVWGDSTSLNNSVPAPDNWPAFMQVKTGVATNVMNHAFGGNVANVGSVQAACAPVTVTVTGNQIGPNLASVAVTSYDVAPLMGLTGANPFLDNYWMLCGRRVVVSSVTYDGSSNPTALLVTPTDKTTAATPVPAGSLMYCLQGMQSTGDFHIVNGWFNSPSQTLTGMQPFVDRFGAANCLLIPALNALSFGGGPNGFAAAMTAKWPGRVFDWNGGLTSPEVTYCSTAYGYTQTAQDLIDNGNNLFPTGCRMPSDNIHANRMGSDILCQRIIASAPFQQVLKTRAVWEGNTGEMRAFSYQPSNRWLQANGATFSSGTYPELFACLGTTTLPNCTVPGTPGVMKYFVYTGAA